MPAWDPAPLKLLISSFYGFSDLDWGAELGGLSSHNRACTADGKDYVLKRYGAGAQAQLARLEGLAVCLHQHGFPAPVPVPNRHGQLHSVVKGVFYALFQRAPGRVLHQDTLSPQGLASTAAYLSRLHGLGTAAAPWLGAPLQAPGLQDLEAAHAAILHRLQTAKVSTDHRALIAHSLKIKIQVVRRFGACDVPNHDTGAHFVHGDFHNENILYDSEQNLICILDYETSHLGHGAVDVMNFVQFACCNNGYDREQVQCGQSFIRAYIEARGMSAADAYFGWNFFFWRTASSSLFEARLADGVDFFASLIRRDVHKLQNYLRCGQDIAQALIP